MAQFRSLCGLMSPHLSPEASHEDNDFRSRHFLGGLRGNRRSNRSIQSRSNDKPDPLTSPAAMETYRYEPVRENDLTYSVVDKKTGQVWECNVHESKCEAAMFPRWAAKGGVDHWESTPNDDSNTALQSN
jgi:hypothetical protein